MDVKTFRKTLQVVVLFVLLQDCCMVQFTKKYRRYSFQPDGCMNVTTKTKHMCTMECAASSNCVAFLFDIISNVCTQCFHDNVTTLTFNRDMFWLRTYTKFNVSTTVSLPSGLLIKMKGKLLSTNLTEWRIVEKIGYTNKTVVPIRVGFQSNYTVTLTAMTEKGWVAGHQCNSTVLFQAEAELDLTILTTLAEQQVYLNNRLMTNLSQYVDPLLPTTFYVFNSFKVMQISS